MKIVATTRLCASLANPNKKTTAPIMHNAGFDAVGANLRYVAFQPEDIGKAIEAIKTLDFVGVSVSKPFKQDVIQYLDDIDDIAGRIGAVNVVHNENGRLKGYNSDWIGAIGALEELTELKGKHVSVLGAGGAARAVAFGLLERGANVKIFNRSTETGSSLAKELGAEWCGSPEDFTMGCCEIIVNATPVGRQDPSQSLLDPALLREISVVMDINVQKEKSQLRLDAERLGAKTIGGVRMLVLQGVFAFELFSGMNAPVDVMQAAVLAEM